jgi:hypothetical protein
MKLRRFVLGTAALGLLCAGMGRGQEGKPVMPANARFGDPTSIARQYQSYLFGIIKKLGKHQIILEKTRFGVDTAVKLTSKTRYIRNKKKSKLAALQVGDSVFVDVKNDRKTGDIIAKKILSGVMPGT